MKTPAHEVTAKLDNLIAYCNTQRPADYANIAQLVYAVVPTFLG